MSMFAKAVEQKKNAEAKKPVTLEQQLFPSSSPAAGQATSKSSLHQFRYAQNILQPSSSAVHNTLPTNALKRTSTEANLGCDCPGSSHTSGSCERTIKRAMSTMDQSPVTKLHQNVEFDENYNSNVVAMSKSRSADTEAISYPDLSKSQVTLSSATEPWSSSPIEHFQSRGLYPDLSSHQPNPLTIKGLAPATGELGRKGRKLPWMKRTEKEDVDNPFKAVPPQAHTTLEQALKKRDPRDTVFNTHSTDTPKVSWSSKPKAESAATPGPTKSPYIWDKTGSALKKEKSLSRIAAKKQQLVKTIENGDPDVKAKVEKELKQKNPAKVFLSEEQHNVLNLVADEKRSVFFTGSAGTGKSVLLRQIIRHLRDFYRREPERVAVTASTGLAACNVGGVTLHSFAGIGLGKEPVPELVKKIRRNVKAKTRWLRTRVLIVDEISMVDGELFDKLEAIARTIRNNGRPFGGIQLVVTGDFFQLPPVPDHSGRNAKFAFDALTWNTSIDHTIGLTQVFRQKDPVFANILNEMRLGNISPTSVATFKRLSRPLDFKDEFEATELFPTRMEVEAANNNRMRNLGGNAMDFVALDGGAIMDLQQRDKLLANCMAPQRITLKKGAQVMLIKNIDETLVNGSLGKVVAFMDEKTFDIYHEDEENFQPGGTQDPTNSRGRSKLKDLVHTQGTVGANASTTQKWPLVRFHIADGTSRDLLCQHESWKIELPNGEVQASRNQIPLILAWALSIHKAQGQTLERVKVDLGKIFEKGQAYVALSRATCQEGLQVLRFDANKVMAHDKVKQFYRGLYDVGSLPAAAGAGERKAGLAMGLDLKAEQDEEKTKPPMRLQGGKLMANKPSEEKPALVAPSETKPWIKPEPVKRLPTKPEPKKFVKPPSTSAAMPEFDEFGDDFLDDEDVLAEMYRLEH